MDKHSIFGVHITDRLKEAVEVQKALTRYGRNIKTRLGLHEVGADVDAPNGVLILEMYGDEATCYRLANDLAAVEGVEVQKMVFGHL